MVSRFTPPISQDKGQASSRRIDWLDIVRGIAFLMVIYSHLEYMDESIMRYFRPVFLTTFFFVSGYLFKENCSFSKVFEQRTRTLLLPFLALGSIMILMSQVLTFNARVPIGDEIKGLLFQNGKNELLWFVAALYVYSVIFYWVEKMAGSAKRLFWLSIALFIANSIYSHFQLPNIPWHLHSAGYACCWMGLGKCYKVYESKIDHYIDNVWAAVCSLIVYVALITAFDLNISFGGSKWVIDSLTVVGLGLIVMLYVSKHVVQHSRLLMFVGANSLFYFAFHGKVYSLLTTICNRFITEDVFAVCGVRDALAFGIVFADAVILVIPAILVNRYCPYILGKGFRMWG